MPKLSLDQHVTSLTTHMCLNYHTWLVDRIVVVSGDYKHLALFITAGFLLT